MLGSATPRSARHRKAKVKNESVLAHFPVQRAALLGRALPGAVKQR